MENSRKQKQTGDPVRAARVANLLRPEVLNAFDRTAFEHNGYWVWEGILTDTGRKQFAASLQKLQHMNDCILMDTDWAAIDFETRGLAPPPLEQITPEFWNLAVVDQSKCLASSDRRRVHICTNMDFSVRGQRWSRADTSRWGLCRNISLLDTMTSLWMSPQPIRR